jgi:hypothetical protein
MPRPFSPRESISGKYWVEGGLVDFGGRLDSFLRIASKRSRISLYNLQELLL